MAMASDVDGQRVRRDVRESSRPDAVETTLRVVGVIALGLGAASIVVFATGRERLALTLAAVGAIVALVDLACRPGRRRYAIGALGLSVVGLSYSVALLMWGTVR